LKRPNVLLGQEETVVERKGWPLYPERRKETFFTKLGGKKKKKHSLTTRRKREIFRKEGSGTTVHRWEDSSVGDMGPSSPQKNQHLSKMKKERGHAIKGGPYFAMGNFWGKREVFFN